jgi:small-conductance mechanosensitive channel
MDTVLLLIRIVVIATLLGLAVNFANKRLVKYFEGRPHLRFRQQLIQIGGFLLAILVVILFMPFGDVLRGQLLSLYGLIISATIALSSTTLVGNVMAGLMLKTIGSFRPGDYITVGEFFGRITEMDLMHTEIQTEERDLTTLPNLFLVTNPVRVMHKAGTVISVELSLGYDVSRKQIEELLTAAASESGLESPYVQIRELGDFSVTYRVSGMLTEINRLIERRRELRARIMDNLHAADIEIVSPTFMNTRMFDGDSKFVGEVSDGDTGTESGPSMDSLVFDKAEKAESVSMLREKLDETQARIKGCQDLITESTNDQAKQAAEAEKQSLEQRAERLKALIDRKEAIISAKK